MIEIINITDLCNKIKFSLPNIQFKIIGEVSQPKISQGHLYLNIKDEKSSIKTIIWKTTLNKYNKNINEGDKITFYGHLDYYNLSGTVNLIIDQIIENEGIGELQKEYEKLKNELYKRDFHINKMEMPKIVNNILIITSKTGAALYDFLYNLENNKSKIKYEVIDVPVQGIDSPKIISNKINELTNFNYDLIIITRGGGSYQDLFGFSNRELLETIHNFKKIPILSAIGHQIDNPLIDLVADYSCPTPSLAAQYLVDINKNYLNELNEEKNKLKNIIIKELHNNEKKTILLNTKLKESLKELNIILNNYNNLIISELNNNKIKFEYLYKSLDDPNISLYDTNYKKIENNNEIIKDVIYILRWNNQDYQIKVI
jgi:exodeoxyribonuclease VII large subunit